MTPELFGKLDECLQQLRGQNCCFCKGHYETQTDGPRIIRDYDGTDGLTVHMHITEAAVEAGKVEHTLNYYNAETNELIDSHKMYCQHSKLFLLHQQFSEECKPAVPTES